VWVLNEEAIQLLTRELGVADTARFIRQFTSGSGNYTEERKERYGDRSLEDIIAEIKERREDTS
jgi:hypothetical protein